MAIDLTYYRQVENFEKWFNYAGRRRFCPTVFDYFKIKEYYAVLKQAQVCPQCGQPPLELPKDYRYSSTCANKHSWHICVVHRKIVSKASSKSDKLDVCTCTGG